MSDRIYLNYDDVVKEESVDVTKADLTFFKENGIKSYI